MTLFVPDVEPPRRGRGDNRLLAPSVPMRMFGFGIAPLVAAVSPLLVLPVLARSLSTSEWASLAIGQSVGGIAALVISMGWTVTGPAEVARADGQQRRILLAESLWSRSLLAPVVLAATAVAVMNIPGVTATALAVMAACAAAGQGFSLTWYAIGVGRARLLIGYEALPRLAGSITGAVLVAVTGVAVVFPVALLFSMVIPWWIFWARELPTAGPRVSGRQVAARWRRNAVGVATEAVAGAYSVGASALVGITASADAVALFNAGERVTRFGSQGISVTGAAMQGWVAESTGRPFVRRVVVSLLSQTAIGISGFLILSLAGPQLTALMLGERLRIDSATGLALGIFFLLWALETVTGRHVLAARGHLRALLGTTVAGSLIGIAAIQYGAEKAGASGAATGLALALGVIVLLQSVIVARVLRREWHQGSESNCEEPTAAS